MVNHFERAYPVLDKIEQAGFEAYFVGGCVRDHLLGKSIADVDIATSAYPEEIKSIFSHTVDVGIEHGTVLVLHDSQGYEITTFRTESTYQDYRRPDQVTFVRHLKDDLMRRDFTINALAMNKKGDIFDYYDGQTDLKRRIIRAVGSASERFHEDALRMMRGVRFSAQLGFAIEDNTLKGMLQNAHLLEKIAVERIAVELQKLWASEHKQMGIRYMIDTNLHVHCPMLADYNNALLALAQLPVYDEPYVNWGILLYLGNVSTTEAKAFLKQWKLSNDVIANSLALVEAIQYRLSHEMWENSFLFAHKQHVVAYAQHFIMQTTDFVGEDIHALYERLPIQSIKELQVDGRDILTELNRDKAGPFVGEILNVLTEKVLRFELENTKEVLRQYITTHFAHYKG